MKQYVQITSGRGPQETCAVVYKVFKEFIKEIKPNILSEYPQTEPSELSVFLLDKEEWNDSKYADSCWLSCTLILYGTPEEFSKIRSEWEGTIQWTATKNQFRPNHKRKNWFVGISFDEEFKGIEFDEADVKFETMRSRGPGGQHVNRTESAVRAIHVPTGIFAISEDERSQFRNKEIAKARLFFKIMSANMEASAQHSREVWNNHNSLQRGNPIKTFKGVL